MLLVAHPHPHESILKAPTLDASYSERQVASASANFDAPRDIPDFSVSNSQTSPPKPPTLDTSYNESQVANASASFDLTEHSHPERDPHHLPDVSGPNPYESLPHPPTLDASYSESQVANAPASFDAAEHSHSEQDPHDLPNFSNSNPHKSFPQPPTLDASYSERQAAAASANFDAPNHSHSDRDPHDLPDFSGSNPQTSPVLFLPPLLSALPYGLSHTPAPSPDQPPLTTETHLPNIDPASLSLHKALHYFSPVTPQYAINPYAESFNWDALRLPEDQEREWYVVAFRSKRKPGSDSGKLYEADRRAHEEAVQNGGLIMYWYGAPDSEGNNLATCIWQSRRHAIAANSRPHHIVAARLAAASFEYFTLERHVIGKVKGETGVTVRPYTSGDVGW